jgi:hypothetical protein
VNQAVKAAVTLGVDAGGKDADGITREHYMALRRLLAEECRGPYGSAFDEFSLVLRIDGSVQAWGKSGVDNIRFQKTSRYATADVFVPLHAWRDRSGSSIREFLAKEVGSAARELAARAGAEKHDVDGSRLIADVERAAQRLVPN